MVSLIIYRVFNKIKNRKRIYSIILIQFAIGFFILNIFTSLYINIDRDFRTLVESNKNQEFFITAEYIDDEFYNPFDFDIGWEQLTPTLNEYSDTPFDNAMLNKLKDVFPKVDFKLEIAIKLEVMSENIADPYIITYSSDYSKVIINQRFYDFLNNPNAYIINKRDISFDINDNKLTTLNGETYLIEIMELEGNQIYIPFKAYDGLYHPKNLLNTKLDVKFKNNSMETFSKMGNILDFLGSNNGTYRYSINSEYYSFLRKIDTAYEQAAAFNLIAGILLAIIAVGLSGLFVLIINSRKRELAVLLALGTTKTHIFIECLLEVAILSFSGCVIGILISLLPLGKGFEYATVIARPSIISIVIMIVLSLIITIVSILPALIIINRLTPMEILRAE